MPLKVNGEVIPDEQIRKEVERLRRDYERYVEDRDSAPDDRQLWDWSRENVIERTLLMQEARKLEMPGSDEKKDDTPQALEQRRFAMLQERVTAGVPPPADGEISKYYEAHKDEFTLPERVHASHIVKHETSTDNYLAMLNLRERIRKGASFEHMAAQYSDCPEQAGDLGAFPRGHMVKDFEDVAFGMSPGEISEVFETRFGYHIAKVHEKMAESPAPLEEVKEHISRRLVEQCRQDALAVFVDTLKEKAVIEEEC